MKLDRILLKLSGEALAGDAHHGFSEDEVKRVAGEVKKVFDKGIQIGIVIGGGNFWRGRSSNDMDRVKADQIGMLATVMNCIYAADCFRREGMKCRIMTPYAIGDVSEIYVRDKAIEAMENGEIVFFAGGTGHPYFSTDMAAVLRAVETKCDAILSAKAIDGVYDSDPKLNPNAKKYDEMKMSDIVDQKLGVIDLASAVLAMENKLPMLLFGLNEENSIMKAVSGEKIGTIVTAD
ncbi:MAG: UMP kinase [Eubacterium sp.]|nr:UMP kinase [Eubacterium sp.]MCR4846758.1 UMP kinase [Eubacterium sp.]